MRSLCPASWLCQPATSLAKCLSRTGPSAPLWQGIQAQVLEGSPEIGECPHLQTNAQMLQEGLCKKPGTRGLKEKKAATRAALIRILKESLPSGRSYFFSSEGGCAGAAGGACAAGGAGVCDEPDMPSLKLRMPSPSPFITSGMRLPPKKIRTTARTISQ